MRTTTVRLDDEHEELMDLLVDRLQITSAEVLRKGFAAIVRIVAEADPDVRDLVEDIKRRRRAEVDQELKEKLGEADLVLPPQDALEDAPSG